MKLLKYRITFFGKILACFSLSLLLLSEITFAQDAVIHEKKRTLKTYPFGDPSPVPTLAQGKEKIYPYYQFNKYSYNGQEQEWKVVTLENEYIKVFILPEIGGKIWGAIEKSTGKEFIYRNEVLKFRNIALRGPWTSGGIEYNISARGHSPMTATPVNYKLLENDDGSVSCVIGATDFSSRTRWRVTITLPKDKAYFETESFWYNPTPLNQSHFAWMTTAIKASDDLQFFYPGDHYLGHSGDVHPWPNNDNGRNLSYYNQNNFGPNKSYHVVGEKTDFFGAYWHDENFGFGHWSRYDEMPGKKIWIWSLARMGGIWEDLLTDTDGQYVEVQSGRLFNQSNLMSAQTPFDQTAFQASSIYRWRERWFPVKKTGGLTEVSPHAVLNLIQNKNGTTTLTLMALQSVDNQLKVFDENKPIEIKSVSLDPLEVDSTVLDLSDIDQADLKIILGNRKLVYDGSSNKNMDRPLEEKLSKKDLTASQLYRKARNQANYREFDKALQTYSASLREDSSQARVYVGLAELFYRRGEFQKTIHNAKQALSINTYDASANYIYGLAKWKTGNFAQSHEGLGLAARSMEYRSAAYTVLAKMYLALQDFDRAIHYSSRALNFNTQNIEALKIQAGSHRKKGEKNNALSILDKIQTLDPLNHFARFERYLWDQNSKNLNNFNSLIRNELPQETYLELAIFYANLGLEANAITVLQQAPDHPVVFYWLAYLQKETANQESNRYLKKVAAMSPNLVYPFRLESIPVLKWAQKQNDSWKSSYYLGLIYWHIGRIEESGVLFDELQDRPDYAPFYLTRGKLRKELGKPNQIVQKDYKKAIEMGPDEWRNWHALNEHHLETGGYTEALNNAEKAYTKFPDRDPIEMDYAKALLINNKFKDCISLLDKIKIMPFEGASEGHRIYEQAHLSYALKKILQDDLEEAQHYLDQSKLWPENLGVGKPYHPDDRLQNYLEAYINREKGHQEKSQELLVNVADYSLSIPTEWGPDQYAGVLALRSIGKANEAEKLLAEWENANPENQFVKWSVAHFNGNQEDIRRLESESNHQNLTKLLRDVLSRAE